MDIFSNLGSGLIDPLIVNQNYTTQNKSQRLLSVLCQAALNDEVVEAAASGLGLIFLLHYDTGDTVMLLQTVGTPQAPRTGAPR